MRAVYRYEGDAFALGAHPATGNHQSVMRSGRESCCAAITYGIIFQTDMAVISYKINKI